MPNSQSIWNALLTVVGVALLGCIGWQMSEISKLKEQAATRTAIEFTEEEANQLRRDLTNIMTNIDIRLTLIERDIEWIKIIPGLRQNAIDMSDNDKTEPSPSPPPPPLIPSALSLPQLPQQPQTNQSMRYDLRK